jgi:membrane protease YdiL (CAAX protease family)
MPPDPYFVLNSTFAFYAIALIAGILMYRKYSQPAVECPGKVNTLQIDSVDLIGLALLVGLFAAILGLSQIPVASPDQEINITPALLLVGMVSQVVPGLVVVVLLMARGIRVVEFFGLRWNKARYILVIAPMGVVCTYLFMFGLDGLGYSEWLVQTFGKKIEMQDALRVYQEADAVIIRLLMAISVVIIAPIVEEVVFRGYIYTVTKRYTARLFSTLLSAILFAVVHNYIPGLVPLAFLAILLTISYEITGSLWAPISIHALFNASTLLYQEITVHHQ